MVKIYDTILGEYIKSPGSRELSLDKIASRQFDYQMISFDSLVKQQKLSSFAEVDLKKASNYSAEDVYMTNLLYEKQKKEKLTDNKILNDIELPLIDVLKQMEIDGVKVNRDRLKELGSIFENEIIRLSNSIFEEIEEEFNISSPKQVGEILFEKLKLPKAKKTKTGYSVNSEVLENLAKEYKIAQKILDYRSFSKLNSTYIIGLINLLDKKDFLHTSYNQFVTTTGRLSSTKPNLQNIPSGSGIAGEIRSAFVSRFEGGKIMAFDYSQVEIRILAIMSGDKNLLEAFSKDFDIHSHTAKLIGTTDRKIAKAVNFGIIYGISGFGLSKMINISVKEANNYIKEFFKYYPKVKDFLDNTIKTCEKKGYVETLFGRKRYINGINDRNKIIKNKAEREAINMPVQGTSADIIKIAMIKVFKFIKEENLKSKLIMQVHDELVFDVFPGEEKILKQKVIYIMENILDNNKINLKVDMGIGLNWFDVK